jgi:hypothetical protein
MIFITTIPTIIITKVISFSFEEKLIIMIFIIIIFIIIIIIINLDFTNLHKKL